MISLLFTIINSQIDPGVKMKYTRQKIQQLFAQKPSRAVDIIFTQHKLDQIHQLYSSLQQHKKNNTMSLKQTLQNNYQKMLYCSDLLDQASKYADAVREVTSIIEDKMRSVDGKAIGQDTKDQGIVSRIEGLASRGRFVEAMSESWRGIGEMTKEDRYTVFYLRIEIVGKMERHICLSRLDQGKMEQYSKCLHQLIFETTGDKIQARKDLGRWVKDFSQPSLLFLINKRLDTINQITRPEQANAIIIEILFEYKLATLKNSFNKVHNPAYFQQYFEELGTIIRLYSNIKIQTSRNLKRVFQQCSKKIKNQLSSIFISLLGTGQIVFKTQLYEQLIGSPRFEGIISNFYIQISEGSPEQVENPLNFIKELWHNYFINLIDVFLNQSSPLARVSSLKQNSLDYDTIPDELKIYLHDYSLEQSLHIITEYEEKLKLLNRTLAPIIKNCTAPELISFQEKYNQKIKQITQQCVQFIDSLQGDHTTLKLRKFLLLRFMSAMLTKETQNFNTQFKISLEEHYMDSKLQFKNPKNYWSAFVVKNKRHQTISDIITDFDCFFIGYLEGVRLELKDLVSQIICSTVMVILLYVQEVATGKEKDKMTHTVESLKQKKEKITIMDTISVPYLAKNVFKCSMKPVCIQKQFFQKNILCKPVKIVLKVPEAPIDDFEIGEKEQKQELVKVNIGKSILSLGNNLITGFMKKK